MDPPRGLRERRSDLLDLFFARGTTPVARLHGWYRRTRWWEATTPGLRWKHVRSIAKAPARAARDALQAVRVHGAPIAREHGVSTGRQLAHVFRLALQLGLPPEAYYRYALHDPARRRRARLFVSHQEGIALLTHLDARASPGDRDALADKRSFLARARAHDLPAVAILASFDAGRLIPAAWDGTTPLPARDLFSKPANLFCGIGGGRWRYEHGRWCDEDGAPHDAAGVVAALCERSREGPLVLQERLANHPRLARLSLGGLCTARIVTVRDAEGEVAPLLAVLKMPVGASPVDNFAQGGLAAPIDTATGRLGHAVRKQGSVGLRRYAAHPDTGEPIAGFVLPDWPAALALARRAHEAFPAMLSIGWDVALLATGPLLVEGNDCWDVDLMQLPHDRPLGATAFPALYDRAMRAALRSAPRP